MELGCLYFEKWSGDKSIIAEVIEKSDVPEYIGSYVNFINPKYNISYIRTWQDESGIIYYDVGSYNEFFLFIPNKLKEIENDKSN